MKGRLFRRALGAATLSMLGLCPAVLGQSPPTHLPAAASAQPGDSGPPVTPATPTAQLDGPVAQPPAAQLDGPAAPGAPGAPGAPASPPSPPTADAAATPTDVLSPSCGQDGSCYTGWDWSKSKYRFQKFFWPIGFAQNVPTGPG